MKKRFVILLLFGAMATARAQKQEITLGLNRNHFFDFHQTARVFDSKDKFGISLGWSFEHVLAQKIPYRLTLKFDRYGGDIRVFNGGLGGGLTFDAALAKDVIALGLYPLNFSIKHILDLNFGVELNALVLEKAHGGYYYYQGGAPPKSYQKLLDDGATRASHRFGLGLSARVAYHIPIHNGWSLVPQYQVFYGLSDEIKDIQSNTRSLRHCLAMGVTHKPHLKQAVTPVH